MKAISDARCARRNERRREERDEFLAPKATKVKPAKTPKVCVSGHPAALRKTSFYAWHSADKYTVYWDFGDGSTGTSTGSLTIKHSYAEPGEYTVKMDARDSNGEPHEIKRVVRVHERPRVAIRVLEKAEVLGAKGVAGITTSAEVIKTVTTPVRKPVSAAAKPVGVGAGKALYLSFGSFRKTLISLGVLYASCIAAGIWTAGVSVSPHSMVRAFEHPSLHVAGASLLMMGVAVAASMVFSALLTFVLFFRTGIPQAFGEVVGEGAKKGGVTFREALKVGYVSVKSNTCPRVVVEAEEEDDEE